MILIFCGVSNSLSSIWFKVPSKHLATSGISSQYWHVSTCSWSGLSPNPRNTGSSGSVQAYNFQKVPFTILSKSLNKKNLLGSTYCCEEKSVKFFDTMATKRNFLKNINLKFSIKCSSTPAVVVRSSQNRFN